MLQRSAEGDWIFVKLKSKEWAVQCAEVAGLPWDFQGQACSLQSHRQGKGGGCGSKPSSGLDWSLSVVQL